MKIRTAKKIMKAMPECRHRTTTIIKAIGTLPNKGINYKRLLLSRIEFLKAMKEQIRKPK